MALQRNSHQHANAIIVLRNQHGFVSLQRRNLGRRRRAGRRHGFGWRGREEDAELGALAVSALDGNRAAALLDDAVHDGQTKAGALAGRLGGEERLEDPGTRRLIHAKTVIDDSEDGEFRVGSVGVPCLHGCLNPNGAAAWHGVASVDHQIRDHLFQPASVGPDQGHVRRQVRHERHALPHDSPLHRLNAANHIVKVQHVRAEDLPAAERQQLAREARSSLRRLEDLVQVKAALVRKVDRSVEKQLLRVAQDHGQQVVEIVGHAPCQLADGIHLLRLPQLLFGLAVFGDIDD
ncbi:MAG: hypothetical protein A3J29_21025 [Acidobacteria bacterium RIFCSPLOWO2_12_FULL_67_14b]|nr:MAG: hypothetical protein A3J29_21025 [Acidobacteria bacterium RIFCSPLOWO2_12_FULL_67_14b]